MFETMVVLMVWLTVVKLVVYLVAYSVVLMAESRVEQSEFQLAE
jgi:divalent metal cation (Fe/Co/Zn/Cd) transporter